MFVVVGAHHIKDDGTSIAIAQIIEHPDYELPMTNDIGLILVATPIIFSARVQPIRLPEQDLPEGSINLPAFVSGWGLIGVGLISF